MTWITHSEAVERMTEHVRGLGWNPDIWWHDEVALSDWWDALGWPENGQAYLVAVPSGGCMAWIGRRTSAGGDGLWTLYAYSLALEVTCGEYTDIATAPRRLGQGHKLDDRFVTQWSFGKPPPVPIRPAVVGDWCACREDAGATGRLGIVREIDARGRVVTVQLDRFGTEGRATDYSRKWFAIANRHEACTARWATGQIVWKAYIAMLTALAREQKKALGLGNKAKLVRDDRPTTAPAYAPGSVAPAGYRTPITPPDAYAPPAGPTQPAFAAEPDTYIVTPLEDTLREEWAVKNRALMATGMTGQEAHALTLPWFHAEMVKLGLRD